MAPCSTIQYIHHKELCIYSLVCPFNDSPHRLYYGNMCRELCIDCIIYIPSYGYVTFYSVNTHYSHLLDPNLELAQKPVNYLWHAGLGSESSFKCSKLFQFVYNYVTVSSFQVLL